MAHLVLPISVHYSILFPKDIMSVFGGGDFMEYHNIVLAIKQRSNMSFSNLICLYIFDNA